MGCPTIVPLKSCGLGIEYTEGLGPWMGEGIGDGR